MFQGRYGNDRLNQALSIVGAVFLFLSVIVRSPAALSTAFMLVSLAFFVATLLRMFSRDFQRRANENAKFNAWWSRVRAWWNNLRSGAQRARTAHKNPTFAERRKFKYFACPQCRQRLRVPRGKGKLRVTCTRCGNKFEIKS